MKVIYPILIALLMIGIGNCQSITIITPTNQSIIRGNQISLTCTHTTNFTINNNTQYWYTTNNGGLNTTFTGCQGTTTITSNDGNFILKTTVNNTQYCQNYNYNNSQDLEGCGFGNNGSLYTGDASIQNIDNINDNNESTFVETASSSGTNYVYLNYTVPSINKQFTNVTIQIKAMNATGANETINYTGPYATWTTGGKLPIRVLLYDNPGSYKNIINVNGIQIRDIETGSYQVDKVFEIKTWFKFNESYLDQVNITVSRPKINLTFNTNTSADLTWNSNLGTQHFQNTTNITNYIDQYPVGELKLTLATGQEFKFVNDNTTDIIKSILVYPMTLIVDEKVQALSNVPGDFNKLYVEVYTIYNSTVYLYSSGTTDASGALIMSMNRNCAGICGFVINDTRWDYYSSIQQFLSSSYQVNLYLTKNGTGGNYITFYSNCPQNVISSKTCWLYGRSQSKIGTLNITILQNNLPYSNNIATNQNDVNSTGLSNMPISDIYYLYNITIVADGQTLQTYYTWSNLTNRTIQITLPPLKPNKDEIVLVIIILIMISAVIATVANEYIPGTGIYVFGGILSVFTGSIGQFFIPVGAIGIILMMEVTKRLVG